MDIEKSMNQFINEQLIKFPNLTERDIVQLKIGFAGGVEYSLGYELEALEAKLEPSKMDKLINSKLTSEAL